MELVVKHGSVLSILVLFSINVSENLLVETFGQVVLIIYITYLYVCMYHVYIIYAYTYHVSRVRVHVPDPDNGGLKAPICMSGRGRSCLARLLNLGCLG